MRTIDHFLAGHVVAGTSGRYQDVTNPATGAVTGRTALASTEEVQRAVAAAQAAFPAWADTSPLKRARMRSPLRRLCRTRRWATSRPSPPAMRRVLCRKERGPKTWLVHGLFQMPRPDWVQSRGRQA